ADPHDQDHQSHRVVVEPMPALYTHDAPRPERPTHSSPGSPYRGPAGVTSSLVAAEGSQVQTRGSGKRNCIAHRRAVRQPSRPVGDGGGTIIPVEHLWQFSRGVGRAVEPASSATWQDCGDGCGATSISVLRDCALHCMNQPWLTTSDWPVNALLSNPAKNTAVS